MHKINQAKIVLDELIEEDGFGYYNCECGHRFYSDPWDNSIEIRDKSGKIVLTPYCANCNSVGIELEG